MLNSTSCLQIKEVRIIHMINIKDGKESSKLTIFYI